MEALLGFGHRPRHGLLAIEVLAGGDGIDEVARVDVQRGSDDDRVDVLAIEQPPMIVERIDAGCELFRLAVAAGVNVGDGDELRVLDLEHLLE